MADKYIEPPGGFLLGMGYDPSRNKTKQTGVVGEVVTNPIASGQQLTDFAFSQFKGSSSFDTNLEISASVDASIGVFGGSTRSSYKQRCGIKSKARRAKYDMAVCRLNDLLKDEDKAWPRLAK